MEGLTSQERSKAVDLIRKIKFSTGKDRTDALNGIFEMAKEDKAKLALCQPEMGLVSALQATLRQTEDAFATSWAVSCVGRLSASVKENKEYLSSQDVGIVPELVRLASVSNCKDNVWVFFGNCILNTITVPYLLSERLGLVDVGKRELEANPDYKFVYTFFANAVTIMSDQYTSYFVRMRIHELIVNRLVQAGPDPTKWADRNTGAIYRSMGFVTSFSSLEGGRRAIRELNQKEFFVNFLSTKEKERMQASIIVANLYGRDEGDSLTKSLLQTNADVLQLLVNLLAAILNYNSDSKEVKDYKQMGLAFGVTKMRDATSTLRCLSISDGNKGIMLKHPSFMNLVLQALQLFLDNRPECGAIYQNFQSYAGGGGQDFESISNLMELLLQLSFFYDDDTLLQKEFNKPEYQLVQRLTALINLPASRNLPFDARQHALQLLRRLAPSAMPVSPVTPNPTLQQLKSLKLMPTESDRRLGVPETEIPQHIMLSYAWGCNKAHVVELSKALRALGYDVWRDEEGSSLVPPMSGDIVETMAEAIQHAHLIVICVSREYKDSSNCRSEAKYARQRAHQNKLRIAYVMMDQNYTTVSVPGVDGWLGFMVGTELWYPMWNLSQVDAAAQRIGEIVGSHARLEQNRNLLGTGTLNPLVSGVSLSRIFSS